MSQRLSQNSRAEDRHVEPSCAYGFLEAAERSGLDQSQVAEETTTCLLCLHAQSNPAAGYAIVDVLFLCTRKIWNMKNSKEMQNIFNSSKQI